MRSEQRLSCAFIDNTGVMFHATSSQEIKQTPKAGVAFVQGNVEVTAPKPSARPIHFTNARTLKQNIQIVIQAMQIAEIETGTGKVEHGPVQTQRTKHQATRRYNSEREQKPFRLLLWPPWGTSVSGEHQASGRLRASERVSSEIFRSV